VTDGVLIVDKPAGWTSHDVVARCRKALGQRRVGHAGTLDPDATGVLVVGVGRVTRLLRFAGALSKSYEGDLVLGVATSTLDASGEVTGTWDMSGVSAEAVTAAAVRLTGDILQVPPMVSAVQVGGRRLHQLARQGVEVERQARPVTVHWFRLWPLTDGPAPAPVYRFEVECSSGTYVRSLAADLGADLGGGAHLRRLRRTAVGPFTLDRAVPLDDVGPDAVLAPAEAVSFLEAVVVDGSEADDVRHGRPLADRAGLGSPGPWAVHTPSGRLLAVYEAGGSGALRAAVVLDPA